MSIGVIARLTMREAMRRKVLWGLLILSAVFLAFYALGWAFIQAQLARQGARSQITAANLRTGYSFLLIAGLYAANFLVIMLSVLIPVDTVAGEIATGTIQSIAVKPLRRLDILLGKWIGFVIMLGICTFALSGGVMLTTLLFSGYSAPNWPVAIVVMFLEALALLSVSLLGGTRLSTLANGVLGFGLFGVAFIGVFIEQIGGFFNSSTAVSVGQIATLIMPIESLWGLAVSQMAEGLNPFRFMMIGSTVPDAGVVVYTNGYAAVLLLLALRSFQRRDL